MELDDLKRRWEEQDRKLDASLRLNTRAVDEAVRGRAEVASRRGSWGLILETILAFMPVYWLGSFIADHIGQPRFWIPAVLLDACAIASFGALLRQQIAFRSIDWSAPVLEIQRRLASLRVSRVRATKWTFFLAPLLWAPLCIVAFQGFFGADLYRAFGIPYVVANVLFGLLVLAVALWVSRRYADRMGRSPVVQGILRELGGRNLVTAEGALRALDDFER